MGLKVGVYACVGICLMLWVGRILGLVAVKRMGCGRGNEVGGRMRICGLVPKRSIRRVVT